jgi:hypothetical protein
MPDDAAFDVARKSFIARCDEIKPQAVVCAGSEDDVVSTLAFARERSRIRGARRRARCRWLFVTGRHSDDLAGFGAIEIAGDNVVVGGAYVPAA